MQILRAWDSEVTEAALELLQGVVQQQLTKCSGYLSDSGDAFTLTCFSSESAAIRFALHVIDDCMLQVAWPEALLNNVMCEEVGAASDGQ
jgi:hypothetical protein